MFQLRLETASRDGFDAYDKKTEIVFHVLSELLSLSTKPSLSVREAVGGVTLPVTDTPVPDCGSVMCHFFPLRRALSHTDKHTCATMAGVPV